MKSALLALALFPLASQAHAAQLVCDFGFGSLQEVTFAPAGNNTYRYSVLRNSGGTDNGEEMLPASMFASRDITFHYRGERYRVYADGEGWQYRVYWGNSNGASIIGTADCETR